MSRLRAVPLLLALLPAAALAQEWNGLADVDVVRIVTTNEDGSERETKIWIVVEEGSAYVRTGATRWFANLERDPRVLIRVEETEIRARTDRVTASERIGAVQAAFREKYGFMDRLSGWVRIGGPRIFELIPRD